MSRYFKSFIQLFIVAVLLNITCYAQQQNVINVNTGKSAVQKISLDGLWQFSPIQNNSDTFSMSIAAIDSSAIKITQNHGNWYSVKIPQFLNHIVWWLPHVSDEYERQEDKRMASFPFDAQHTQSGWYLKNIVFDNIKNIVPAEIRIHFEGVAMISRVYCNGHYVGGHLGMFGSFTCRLTPYLNWRGKNTLLVYVERGHKTKNGNQLISVAVTSPITRDMLVSLNSGLFGGFGNGPRAKSMGIWQPVTLKVSQSGGDIKDVFFNPSLKGHRIAFTIHNPTEKSVAGRIEYSLKNDKTGKILVEDKLKELITLSPQTDREINITKEGLSPKLWTPASPNLYTLEVHWLNDNGQLVDSWSQNVGYRTISVKGQQIYLNGDPYWVRGAGQPIYGYKPNDTSTAYHFLQLMHDGNEMVTRTGCNPWNNMWYSAADKKGIGVSAEGVRPWALMSKAPPPPKPILEQWKEEQLETVKQYRNHPSILFYEVSNEGLQGDAKNPEKLAIFKDIIDAMRKLDPSRPIIQTSGDPDYQDIADIEDVHSYWGWYESSSYVNDYTKPMRGLTLQDGRPFMNEECAVPYSSIDNGKVHPNYVPLYSAQPWVGDLGVFGDNSSYYQEHIRAGAKIKAEKLRYSRRELPTAGFMLFCNSTWIQHALSRPPSEWKPFPVYNAVKQAFQPVLVAWQTPQRVFYSGDSIHTRIYVVNDNEAFHNLQGLQLQAQILDSTGKVLATKKEHFGDVPYYAVKDYLFEITIPDADGDKQQMVPAKVTLRLTDKSGHQVSYNTYPIRITSHQWATHDNMDDKRLIITTAGCGRNILSYLSLTGMQVHQLNEATGKADVVFLGPDAKNISLEKAKAALKPGGRIIVLEQGAAAHRFCQDAILPDTVNADTTSPAIHDFMYESAGSGASAAEKVKGEFAEMLGWNQHLPVFNGLEAMDWKWWMQGDTLPAFVCSVSHKINIKNKDVIPIGRFLSPHFYWSGNMKDIYQSKIGYPVFAVKREWGDLIVCDLIINEALSYDPRAAKTLTNLITERIEKKDNN